MRYSVVVLTFGDRLPSLQRCLEKIEAGARTSPLDFEVIVVNNGSEDIRRWLKDWKTGGIPHRRPVVRVENEGVCARNYGLEVARGDYIIQVDDDVLVTPGFDEVLLAPYQNPEVGATGPHGFYQDSTWGILIDDRRRPRPGQFCDLLMGYCWSWRREPRFNYDWDFSPFWHEESDLQLAIRSAGYRLACTPPVATHRTLHDWAETKRDGPVTGSSIAVRNFWNLVDKWADKDIRFEGPAVGLHGPAPGKRIPRQGREIE